MTQSRHPSWLIKDFLLSWFWGKLSKTWAIFISKFKLNWIQTHLNLSLTHFSEIKYMLVKLILKVFEFNSFKRSRTWIKFWVQFYTKRILFWCILIKKFVVLVNLYQIFQTHLFYKWNTLKAWIQKYWIIRLKFE